MGPPGADMVSGPVVRPVGAEPDAASELLVGMAERGWSADVARVALEPDDDLLMTDEQRDWISRWRQAVRKR